MRLDEVADRLYALPPEDFTRARDAAAKDEPALKKGLAALRRPTVAAWVVNVLAREDTAMLDELLALGPELAAAQSAGEGDRLRSLSEQRRGLLRAVTARAVELAGRDLAAAARGEVEATLEAALADPPSADAVRTGRLVRALSFAGFGGVDLDGAVAVAEARSPSTTSLGMRIAPTGGRPAKQAEGSSPSGAADKSETAATAAAARNAAAEHAAALESQALEAAGRLDDAVRSLDAARRAQADADTAVDAADRAVTDAEQAHAAARRERDEATAAQREVARRTTEAEQVVEAEQQRAEQARQALDRLRRSPT